MDVARLKAVPIFAGLSDAELTHVARWTEEIDVPEGKQLIGEDAFGHEFFVIEDGHAEVLQDGESIRLLGSGDFFGEIVLLESERRTATVVARSPMQLIVMHRRDFKQMEREMPAVAQKVEQAIRERFRTPAE